MKRRLMWMIAAVAAPLTLWLGAQATAPRKTLSELMPANPLLYVEAKNFASLVADWNASPEKKTWTGSGSYQSYIRSKLALRLEEVQKAYAEGIGVNPNTVLLENIAGGESAVAIYDVGKLELLYATRLPAARLADNLLMQTRTKFQSRNAGGQTYYVKSTSDGTVAFAVAPGDLLIAGTREDLVAGALQLLAAQQPRPSMKAERWFTDATAKAGSGGAPDLRLVVNLERTVRTPHFRSYWIQQNITELKQYYASISDLQLTQGAWTERRLLLRAEPASPVNESGVAQLAALVPSDAGFHQAWAKPKQFEVEMLLQERISGLSGTSSGAVNPLEERAPGEAIYGTAGSEEDLDQRIDVVEEGLQTAAASSPMAKLASPAIEAVARVAGTRVAADGVFIGVDSALLLLSSSDWNENTVKAAVLAAGEQAWSAAGMTWSKRGAVWELSGLNPMQVWIDGKVLVISNSAALIDRIAAKRGGASNQSGAYISGYRHGVENANFGRMMELMDFPQIPTGDARAPMLFSENLAGIGRVLGRIDSVSMESKDEGALVRQTVVYRKRS